MKKILVIKKLYALVFCSALFISSIIAQNYVTENLDLQSLVNTGKLQISILPQNQEVNAYKLFDSQDFSFVGPASDSLVVTLQFDEAVKVNQSNIFWVIASGTYTLETAGSIDDLENKTNTYAKICEDRSHSGNALDSVDINEEAIKVIKLTAKNSGGSVFIGEWKLLQKSKITGLAILPESPKLFKGTSVELKAALLTEDKRVYPYSQEGLSWSSGNKSIVSFNDEKSIVTGNELGKTTVTVSNQDGSLTGTSEINVVESIEMQKAEQMVIKVALVYQNPVTKSGSRLNIKFGWGNPAVMVEQIVENFYEASGGVVKFEVVETYNDQDVFTKLDDKYMTVDQLDYYYNGHFNELKDLAEKQKRIKFDYKGMIEHYDFYNKRENGEIDEVWVYAHPFSGMYESQLVGKNAIWWNSPPIKDVPENFNKLISVMGWNYERGVAEAMHSVGHRSESALRYVYGRWDLHAADKNAWEKFSSYDQETPGEGHVGNIHFPVNGTSDYDYSNTRAVTTLADNWSYFPNLMNQERTVTCSEWQNGQLGYMKWWFGHLPKFAGVTDGVLNNWWHYIVDLEGGIALAKKLSVVGINDKISSEVPEKFILNQNYPNPFNPSTTISYSLNDYSKVKAVIYNVLGEKIATLVNKDLPPGQYNLKWEAKGIATGVYYCVFNIWQENSAPRHIIKSLKMVLLK
ncbi:MAG: hypothetical protein ACEPO8_08665 [Rhodothermaceae bacterium]